MIQDNTAGTPDFAQTFYDAQMMAEYTRELFRHLVWSRRAGLKGTIAKPKVPAGMGFKMSLDAYHIASLATEAYCNPRE